MTTIGKRRLSISAVMSFLVLLSAGVGLAADESRGKSTVVEPFNGKNLEGWTFKGPADRNKWVVGVAKIDPDNPRQCIISPSGGTPGELINSVAHGLDIHTNGKWGDCGIDLEFMVPKGSNSGVYLMGEYEIQILDSHGKEHVGTGDLGGLYSVAAPRVNAARKPGEWQTLSVDFIAPRFEGDKKTANARFVKIVLNGQVIHENVEMHKRGGGGVTGREAPTGPLMFQGNHGVVAYRNIRITLPAKD